MASAMLILENMKLPARLQNLQRYGLDLELELLLGGLGAVLILRWLM